MVYWSSLTSLCPSFTSLHPTKVVIFSDIVCCIDSTRENLIQIPVHRFQEQIKAYLEIKKLTQMDNTGVICRSSKFSKSCPSEFDQLWQLITFPTEVHRGSVLRAKKDLDLLYKLCNTRTSGTPASLFFSPLNLVENSKTRDFSLLKFPKSSLGMNFKRGILRGFLTVSLEMNLGHQSNIYLWMTITEFFSNRLVLA
jgi:hypothetical protein